MGCVKTLCNLLLFTVLAALVAFFAAHEHLPKDHVVFTYIQQAKAHVPQQWLANSETVKAVDVLQEFERVSGVKLTAEQKVYCKWGTVGAITLLVVFLFRGFSKTANKKENYMVLNLMSEDEYQKSTKKYTGDKVTELYKTPEFRELMEQRGKDPKNYNWQRRQEETQHDDAQDLWAEGEEPTD
eukprot:GDKI01011295.1.p1 GENE.GDKI01011295.1~~GDKI01011295.1.p1  ORF type:complete len:184 (-),score=54.31 GDKI01011295.1:40-591(-)